MAAVSFGVARVTVSRRVGPWGRKYAARDVGKARAQRAKLPVEVDAEKAESAKIFYEAWQRLERDRTYAPWRRQHG